MKVFMIVVALADEHVVTDADDVGHEGDHVSRLADGLAVGDLGLLLVQILHLKAQQVGGGAKEKRVRVELSRKIEMPRPESKILEVILLRSRRSRRASATVKTALISSSVLSQCPGSRCLYMFLMSASTDAASSTVLLIVISPKMKRSQLWMRSGMRVWLEHAARYDEARPLRKIYRVRSRNGTT